MTKNEGALFKPTAVLVSWHVLITSWQPVYLLTFHHLDFGNQIFFWNREFSQNFHHQEIGNRNSREIRWYIRKPESSREISVNDRKKKQETKNKYVVSFMNNEA